MRRGVVTAETSFLLLCVNASMPQYIFFMKQLTFLITSGPTREYIDPVRYISNESSGKMGAALCDAALKGGHKVIFISGKAQYYPSGKAEIINVISADDMFKAVKKNFKRADIIIGAAAVSDFKPASFSKSKIKKKNVLTLKLKQNPDILAYCGKNKKGKVVAGFALETDDLIKNAGKKLKDKNLDLIIANGKQSLGADKTKVSFIRQRTNNKEQITNNNLQITNQRQKGSGSCHSGLDPESILLLFPGKSRGNVDTGFRRYDTAEKLNYELRIKKASKKIIAEKIIDETISIFANIKVGEKFA